MSELKRITIYADDSGSEPSEDFRWVDAWLTRWGSAVRIANYSSGGWEHIWDVEGPPAVDGQVSQERLDFPLSQLRGMLPGASAVLLKPHELFDPATIHLLGGAGKVLLAAA